MTEDRVIDREEAELLLPWYERGTLADAEMRRIEARLAADPELRARLELIREEAAETVVAVERVGMPRRASRERLMAQIAVEAGATPATRGLRDWLMALLPVGLSPALAMAGAAAILVIALQAVALVALLPGDAQRGPGLASGDKPAQSAGTFAQISFKDTATVGQINTFIRSIGGVIVDGPKPGGTYKLRISPKALADAERDRIIADIAAKSDLVAFVTPTQ